MTVDATDISEGLSPALASLTDVDAPLTDADGNTTFAGRFFERLVAWFADAANGITKFFASEVHTDTLCIGETCVTESELKELLAHKSANVSPNTATNDIDTTPPTISIIGANPAEITVGTGYSDLGATAHDTEQGDLSVITYQRTQGEGEWREVSYVSIDTEAAGEHEIRYEAVDNDGNTAHAVRTVIVTDPDTDVSTDTATITPDTATTTPDTTPQPKDTTPPTITLNGDSALTLTLGDTYTEEGATATDDTDGDLTSSITVSGSVDTQTMGEHRITYTVSDTAENEATAVRIVTVVEAELTQESMTESEPIIEPEPGIDVVIGTQN